MTAPTVAFTTDDIFLLGNIATLAIREGRGEEALPILHLIQDARPGNAGPLVLQATYRHSVGDTAEAIRMLEESTAFEASINRDEALAFHLYLLQQDEQLARARTLGEIYLDEGLVTSPEALGAIRTVVLECAAALETMTGDADTEIAEATAR